MAAEAHDNLVFGDKDFFADAQEENQTTGTFVHIRTQQRNGKKSWTTVQGLPTDLDLKKILRVIKKLFNTNGTIIHDEEAGEVIQVQGDKREVIYNFFLEYNICKKEELKKHGF